MARTSSALLKRRLKIAEIVRAQGEVKIETLSELLRVSNVTIRQDLTYLEQQSYLKRSFGGAIYINPERVINHSHSIEQSVLQNSCNYRDIDLIKNCLNYIHDGDTLFLSHGSLIRKLIPFLHIKKSLVLITNDIDSAKLAKELLDAEIILIGGSLIDSNVLTDNKIFNFIISQYQISLFIIELNSITSDNLLLIENIDLLNIYKIAIKNAKKTIAVLPQKAIHPTKKSIGKLATVSAIILSNLVISEYHQQLLDSKFFQLNSNKYCTTYQSIVEE